MIRAKVNNPRSALAASRAAQGEIQSLVYGMESALVEAAVALERYEREKASQAFMPHGPKTPEQWEAAREKTREEESRIAHQLDLDSASVEPVERYRAVHAEKMYREMYARAPLWLYAKAFLLALDRIEKLLGTLGTVCADDALDDPTEKVRAARDHFNARIPRLRAVRDSTAHSEERARRRSKGKPIALKPISEGVFANPGGNIFVHEAIVGDNFGSTLQSGEYGEVAVTAETLEAAREAVQLAIDGLPWK